MTAALVRVAPVSADGSLGAWLASAAGRLKRAGIMSARLDARLLVSMVLEWDQARILARPEHLLTAAEGRRLETLIARREKREPMAYITGRREFWGLEFRVGPGTLVPRPESETLIQAALKALGGRQKEVRILDLGTGSGCLLLALLKELPSARGWGLDVSEKALSIARENASTLGMEGRARFLLADWASGLEGAEGRFDLIVANPPYVADGDFAALEPEVVRFEPSLALSAGPDGLRCYRALVPGMGRLLAAGGRAFVEIGAGQAGPVSVIFRQHGLEISRLHDDLAAIPRVIEARRAKEK